jgi:hypothetical protein
MKRPLLRRPSTLFALIAAIVGCGVLTSGVGIGALPPTSLPPFGVTTGAGSLSTVAELGDVNGDHINDYAVGLPSANSDAGMVYVFLGQPGGLAEAPTALDLSAASFTITGHAGEMLGYSIAGADVNGDHINDIAMGAPMAGAPSKTAGGAVYVVFGSHAPVSVATASLYPNGAYTNAATNPAAPSLIGSRYDGFQVNSHTGMSLTALPDLNGDGLAELAVGSPDVGFHRPLEGNVAVLWGKALGVHITLNDLWGAGYPYYFHIDFPAIDQQHVGVSVASVGDMTGDGLPDIAIGAPYADYNGRIDSGSVWIISGHRQDIGPPECYTMTPPASPPGPCHLPWIKLYALQPGEGYRIDGAAAGDELGSSLAGVGDQNGDGVNDVAIGEVGASPSGRAHAGQVVVVAGVSNFSSRDLATSAPLQTIIGAAAGAGLGASVAAAGDDDVDGHVDILAGAPGEAGSAGAVYLVRGAAGTSSDLLQASTKIAPFGGGAMTGSNVAAGSVLDSAGADALIAAPGAGAGGSWLIVGGSGTAVLPPPPGTPSPPAPPSPPPAPPSPPPAPPAAPPSPPAVPQSPPVTTTTGGSTGTSVPVGTVTQAPSTTTKPTTGAKPVVKKKKKKLPLCPIKKPKTRYHLVNGKRVKVKPKPCRPRAKKTAVKSS